MTQFIIGKEKAVTKPPTHLYLEKDTNGDICLYANIEGDEKTRFILMAFCPDGKVKSYSGLIKSLGFNLNSDDSLDIIEI